MKKVDKEAWARRVTRQMQDAEVRGNRVLVLAGVNYRGWLYGYLMTNFEHMDIPLAGLMMGQQLSWLSKNSE
jgi:hypothetical protein